MIIPKLVRSTRIREYEDYSDKQRAEVVRSWLFEGKSYRQIDKDVLHLDSNYSKGYQSMGILHYLGLRKEFRGLFDHMTIAQALSALKATGNADYQQLISILASNEKAEEIEMQNDIDLENEEVYEVHLEGHVTEYYSTRYERDPRNREAAIQIHGTICMACGFDFEKTYGERGKNYIEVHHIVPLAFRDEEVLVDPEKDLIVVCSNCHRMIHRKRNQILSLKELKKIIAENK